MRCYSCGDEVAQREHSETLQWFNDRSQSANEFMINNLSLVHCVGPEDRFDEDGCVVICKGCARYSFYQYIRFVLNSLLKEAAELD